MDGSHHKTANYDQQPRTPLHPRANEEFQTVPSMTRLADLQMDLNPDLTDDETDNNNVNKGERYDDGEWDDDMGVSKENLQNGEKSNDLNNQLTDNNNDNVDVDDDDDDDEDIDDEMFNSDEEDEQFEEVSHKRKVDEVYNSGEKFDSDIEPTWSDFEPVNSPFSNNDDDLTKLEDLGRCQQKRLSSSQNSKLIAYIDHELLMIQRKFIQSFSDDESRGDQRLGYHSLSELLVDLNKITEFIWYTVKVTQRGNGKCMRSFYQGQYFIKIAGDLVDYLQKYSMSDRKVLKALILFVQKLDQIFVKIVDDLQGFDSTEKVRLVSITERTRVAVINLTIKYQVNDYKYEIGRLYEGIIDKISE
ncbi:TFIIH complex subunit [Saccharomycopsis crataegensis]|uniref:TFIIH complex subunit n=1 Tax=Saccharomycopsis crataegensis TaxID=43959 RepID=A0AAV5QQB6_9ASCO|nr:TFIIH complex subunit [Saccharomycopsis crataegensis]